MVPYILRQGKDNYLRCILQIGNLKPKECTRKFLSMVDARIVLLGCAEMIAKLSKLCEALLMVLHNNPKLLRN